MNHIDISVRDERFIIFRKANLRNQTNFRKWKILFRENSGNYPERAKPTIFRKFQYNFDYKGLLKGTDRLWKVVELNMQCCGQILYDSFGHIKLFKDL